MDTFEVISRVVPIILLFAVGYVFRRTGFLAPRTAAELKKLVANVTLPALMLRAFMSLDPGGGELLLAAMMFGLCLLLLAGSRLIMGAAGRGRDIRAFMVSGFEAGMLGYALFMSVFGDESLAVFASVDLGQVLFVFIVLMPILLARTGADSTEREGRSVVAEALRRVIASPVVWSIVVGLVLGILGRALDVDPQPFAPIGGFLEILGNLTVPLIALAIGYELSFRRDLLGRAVLFVLVRKAVLLGLAVLLVRILPVDNALTPYAFMTMLLLPPPFVVTLAARDDEQPLVSAILSMSTVVSIPAFALAILLMGV